MNPIIEPSEIPSMSPERLWQRYRQQVYGDAALSPAQARECRNAFFAGMKGQIAFFQAVTDLTGNDDALAMRILHEWDRALRAEALGSNPTGQS